MNLEQQDMVSDLIEVELNDGVTLAKSVQNCFLKIYKEYDNHIHLSSYKNLPQ